MSDVFEKLAPYPVIGEACTCQFPAVSMRDAGVALAQAKTAEQFEVASGAMTRAMTEVSEITLKAWGLRRTG